MLRNLSSPALVALFACASCGHGAPAHPVGNQLPSASATAYQPTALADDVAELTRAAHDGEQQSAWSQRVTFLGWTSDHRVAYRVLLCDPDELGGRGPYCELRVCVATEPPAVVATENPADDSAADDNAPTCEDAASFELYGDIAFDPAATTAAADAAIAKLGPLAAGTAKPLDQVTLTIADLNLTAQLRDGRRRTIIRGMPDLDLGVVKAEAVYVGDSADGRCRAAVGLYAYRSEYEGVHGTIPNGFAVVACAAP